MNKYPLKKLWDICDILDNKRKPVTQSDRIPWPYPYYGATGILDYVSDYIFDEKLILIGEDGAKWWSGENTAFTAEWKYWVNNHAHVIRPHRDIVCDDWIIYFLNITDLLEHVTGVTVPKLNQGKLREILIPLPPLSTQLDIVAWLDSAMAEIDALRTETESALTSTRELWESTLESVFASGGNDWEEKRLSEICEKITDGTHQTPTYYTDGIIFLSSRNVTSGKIDWDNIKYIDHKQHVEMHKRVNPRMNDILLAKNGTTGVAAMVDRDTIFDIYVSLALLRAREMILPSLLLFFINSPVAKKQFNKRLKWSGVPNLHLEEIREVAISFPKSLPEQSRIVAHLDAVRAETERLERLYTEKLTSLDELRRSVLADVFS